MQSLWVCFLFVGLFTLVQNAPATRIEVNNEETSKELLAKRADPRNAEEKKTKCSEKITKHCGKVETECVFVNTNLYDQAYRKEICGKSHIKCKTCLFIDVEGNCLKACTEKVTFL
uniref:Uncharacterized protein n=1 Tax=Clytia hemisphaerica TaxID=252671 RepID=A0A7M5X1R3_9CNID